VGRVILEALAPWGEGKKAAMARTRHQERKTIMETPPAANKPSPARGWEALVVNPQQVTISLLGIAALFALIPVYLWLRFGWDSAWGPVFIWGVAIALIAAILAVVNATYEGGGRLAPAERVRLEVMVLGGAVGLLTSLLGLTLPLTEYSEIFKKGIKEWRANPWPLAWTCLALFGGLTLMFVSLLFTRGAEKAGTTMRRFLLGYNAVLSTLLLAVILGLINVLPYTNVGPFTFFNRVYGMEASGIYNLSDSTRNFLAELQQPVKVYVLLPRTHRAFPDVQALLENCRNVTNKISWSGLSRDLNQKDLEELIEKYQIPNSLGLLVLYGPEGKVENEYVKLEDFYSRQADRSGETSGHVFKGESALMKALTFLAQGKSRSVIYFTQGHEELDWNDRSTDRPDQGLGALRDELSRGNYDLKELRFGPDTKRVPEDADVVVIARPRLELPANAIQALRDYLKGAGGKKGKLIVLLDVITRRDGGMVRTGLEGLLREFNVQVGDDRVLDATRRPPNDLAVVANFNSSNPIAKAFVSGRRLTPFNFDDARTVTPAPANPMGAAAYSAETLIQTPPSAWAWSEKDLVANPVALISDLLKPENRERLIKLRSQQPLSVAVTVTEPTGGRPPPMPGHPPIGGDSQPRMVVFGDASWVSNQLIQDSQFGSNHADLFRSCLAWLRERPEVGGTAEGTERKQFVLGIDSESPAATRLRWLPASLMLLGVVGVAGGVWVVRRR
jgi:hypothetical protein